MEIDIDTGISSAAAIKGETRPIEGHTDPNAIQDCWENVFDALRTAESTITALEEQIENLQIALRDIAMGPLQEPDFKKYAVSVAKKALPKSKANTTCKHCDKEHINHPDDEICRNAFD